MAAMSVVNGARVFGANGVAMARVSERGQSSSLRVSAPGRTELVAISGEVEFDEVLQRAQQEDSIVVIEWMAQWCRKCIYLKPQLEKLATEFQNEAKFYFVDVNSVPHALVKRVGVSKMPTIQVWKNKEKTGEVIGGQKAGLVVEEVKQMLQDT